MNTEQTAEMRTIITNVLVPDAAPETVRQPAKGVVAALAAAEYAEAGTARTVHRIIEMFEDLETLPVTSAIMDDLGCVFQLWPKRGWEKAGPSLGAETPVLPAVVLFEPETGPAGLTGSIDGAPVPEATRQAAKIAEALTAAGFVKADHVEYAADHKHADMDVVDEDGDLWESRPAFEEYYEWYGNATLLQRSVGPWIPLEAAE